MAIVKALWPAISLPWSQVIDDQIALSIPATALCRAVNTSLLVCLPGRWPRTTNRLTRSTSVITADWLFLPRMRSPSQWPGKIRSLTSSGRSSMRLAIARRVGYVGLSGLELLVLEF